MSEELQIAFELLAVGMITVFLILFLVVQSGRLLIVLVNRFSPVKTVLVADSKQEQIEKPDAQAVAILTGVVAHITGGQGKITSIKKDNDG